MRKVKSVCTALGFSLLPGVSNEKNNRKELKGVGRGTSGRGGKVQHSHWRLEASLGGSIAPCSYADCECMQVCLIQTVAT